MANFETAFQFMAPHEWSAGKTYTNDPDDPGGSTNYGITQFTLNSYRVRHQGFPDSVEDLTPYQAKQIYKDEYWIWQDIQDDRVAAKLFDMGVNMGPSMAVRGLQTVIGYLGHILVVDGKLGSVTIAQANACSPHLLLPQLCGFQRRHYEGWIGQSRVREKYRAGLMARADDIPQEDA